MGSCTSRPVPFGDRILRAAERRLSWWTNAVSCDNGEESDARVCHECVSTSRSVTNDDGVFASASFIGDDDLWGTFGRLESSTAGELYTSVRYDIALNSRSDTVCPPFVNSAAHGRRSDSPLRRPRLASPYHITLHIPVPFNHPRLLLSTSTISITFQTTSLLPSSSSLALSIALWAGHMDILRAAAG